MSATEGRKNVEKPKLKTKAFRQRGLEEEQRGNAISREENRASAPDDSIRDGSFRRSKEMSEIHRRNLTREKSGGSQEGR